MSFKKGFCIIVLALFVSVSCFSQVFSTGITGSYNGFNPSFWNTGFVMGITGNYSGNTAHFFRFGMTFGEATLTYERANKFSSTQKMTEYWQKSFSWDLFAGYVFQIGFTDVALRLGADWGIITVADAYSYTSNDKFIMGGESPTEPINMSLTGIVGIALFPKRMVGINIDICPGWTINPVGIKEKNVSELAFILPIRVSVTWNEGPDVK